VQSGLARMTRIGVLTHDFVESIPDHVEDGRLYISVGFATAVHKCCCGCGKEVVTPLSPTDWKLIFDGRTVSLHPSIGNWSFDCKSHYWIQNNRVRWARRWTQAEIASGRSHDGLSKNAYFTEDASSAAKPLDSSVGGSSAGTAEQPRGLWRWMPGWRFGRKR
jgi:Family of unknown function (DUF6527)